MSHLVRYQFSGIAEYYGIANTLYQLYRSDIPNIIISLYFAANYFQIDVCHRVFDNECANRAYLLSELSNSLVMIFKVSTLNILEQLCLSYVSHLQLSSRIIIWRRLYYLVVLLK